MIDLYSSFISFIVVTLGSTYLVALAYKNTKFVLKHKVTLPYNSIVIIVYVDRNMLYTSNYV